MACLSTHTCMTWSDPHQVQCGCAGLMSHRCDRQVSTQSPQSQTIPYFYNPQSPMMKHPSRKNDELQKSRDQVRCLCRKFKEQEKDEPQDKLSFDKLVRNDEHLIQDVPWELGGIPNIQDDDMGEAKAKL